MKKSFIIHPILFAIFPILFLFTHNIHQVKLNEIFIPIVITVCFSLAFWSLLKLFLFKDKHLAGLVVSLFLLLFFSYGHFSNAINGFPQTIGVIIITDKCFLIVCVLIFLIGVYFFKKIPKKLPNITKILNIISFTLIFFSLIQIGGYKIKSCTIWQNNKPLQMDKEQSQVLKKNNGLYPNIFFIILDAYAGAEILNEIYEYQNNDLIDYLAQKGFYIANKSRSNYYQTSLSLASNLNLDYLDNLFEQNKIKFKSLKLMTNMIKNNKVFHFLRQYGYKIIAFSSGCPETEIDNADIYLSPQWNLSEFQNEFINTTPIPTMLNILKIDLQTNLHRKKILYIFDHLSDISNQDSPFFVFAHIKAPHPPFVFDRCGEKINLEEKFSGDDGSWLIRKGRFTRTQYIKSYIDQLIFINNKIKITIDAILSNAKTPPIIILQGDHGPRSMFIWGDTDMTHHKECFSILNAYYFPDKSYASLYDEITSVNTFRIVMNQYFSGNYEILEDKSYFSIPKSFFRFINVDDKIQNPDYANVHILKGTSLLWEQEFQKAIIHFSAALQLEPNNAIAHNNLGYALANQGDLKQAYTHFAEAVRLKPDFEFARKNLELFSRMLDRE
ncbi:MAG: tetratricopeptide repeat protein [bacterium]